MNSLHGVNAVASDCRDSGPLHCVDLTDDIIIAYCMASEISFTILIILLAFSVPATDSLNRKS